LTEAKKKKEEKKEVELVAKHGVEGLRAMREAAAAEAATKRETAKVCPQLL